MTGLPHRIAVASQAVGLSYRALAKKAGISPRQLRRLLNEEGKRGSRLDTIEQLAKALGVSPGFLAFGEENGRT